MDKKSLQNDILEKKYQQDKWLSVLQEYFGAKKFHQSPVVIAIPTNEIASEASELGSFYTADERLIGIYKVSLTQKAWVAKNRVGLRNLLRHVYKYDVDGALIVFEQGDKWRFSFVSEINTIDGKKETEPKRFTYLFGDGESCRTAADRFDKLKGKALYLADIFEAFSVEKLNKEFFKVYKEFYEKFSSHLAVDSKYRKLFTGSVKEFVKGWKDDAAKPIRDFSKKLLGRIVFLQFLEKKRWMAVPAKNEIWEGGDPKFLFNLFQNNTNKKHFHSEALKTLFFETLNKKRTNDIAPAILGKNIKIPYLNGGLFDKDLSYTSAIDYPEDLFKNLLEFFESYNFTIDENDPYDSEIGIDPEMLGHIFENLLEENREKGAFYTPKEIVHYMCQESLIQYLRTHMPECTEDDSPATKAVENFIRHGITGERNDKKNYIVQQAKRIEKLLDKVKICDPAIGSGAFPMGMLQEIFKAKTTLDLTLDHADVKKKIIQESIYGVDIENGAIEIARLRFWLALVVDENKPQPLPNLDYKIMQGNSLLESFEGIDLSKVHTISKTTTLYEGQKDIFGNLLDPQMKLTDITVLQENNLQQLMTDFFGETNPDKKQKQREQINQTVHEHIDYNLELWQSTLERQLAEAPKLNMQGLKAATKKKIENLQEQLDNLKEKRKRLVEVQAEVNKPYFLWHLFFADVFEKGGFDIVIGNPPYIQLQKMGKDADTLQQANFETFTRTGDIYMLFFEQGYRYLKPKGNLVFITGSAWLRSNYGKSLRNFFLNNTNGKILIDLSDAEVFESATVLTTIHLFKKEKNNTELKALRLTKKNQEFIKNLAGNFEAHHTVLKSLNENAWVIADSGKQHIKQKISAQGKKLSNWNIDINRGILTGFNEAFVIDEETKNELIKEDPKCAEIIKPLLRGRDLGRYSFRFQKTYLLNIHNGIKQKRIPPIRIDDYPSIRKHLTKYKNELQTRLDQGDNWYNLRNCAYLHAFDCPKIIYPNMVKDLSFTFDDEGYYLNDKCFIMNGDHLQYLVAFFNSKLFRYCFEDNFPELQGNSREIKGFVMNELPIKEVDKKREIQFEKLTKVILTLKKQNADSSVYENKIDALVFHLYELTEQEMLQVLDTFKDLSLQDRNQIQNEYWNIGNGKFSLEL